MGVHFINKNTKRAITADPAVLPAENFKSATGTALIFHAGSKQLSASL